MKGLMKLFLGLLVLVTMDERYQMWPPFEVVDSELAEMQSLMVFLQKTLLFVVSVVCVETVCDVPSLHCEH